MKLRSDRLEMRPVVPGDVTSLHQHWTRPEVRRYLWDDEVIPLETVQGVIETSRQLFDSESYGLWVVTRGGDFVGCCGFWEFHDPPQVELIISLEPSHWGRGMASELGTCLMEYAWGTLGWDEVLASTDAPNDQSLKLIDRLGFEPGWHPTAAEGKTRFFVRRRDGD